MIRGVVLFSRLPSRRIIQNIASVDRSSAARNARASIKSTGHDINAVAVGTPLVPQLAQQTARGDNI
jgi:high-affinity K+ transport system ATPase subunit B